MSDLDNEEIEYTKSLHNNSDNRSEEEIIKQFEHWIEYEKQHKDKINKADELIEIQQGLLDLYNKQKEQIEIMEKEFNRLEDLEDDREQLKGLLNKEKEERQKFEKAFKQRMEYSHELEKDLFENCSNYVISKDKIRKILDKYAMTEITEYDNVVKFYKEIKNLVEGDTNE